MATDKEQRTIEIILKAQEANASLKEMAAGAAVMKAQLSKMAADDPGRAKLVADLQLLNGRIAEGSQEMRGQQKSAEQLREEQERLAASALKIVVDGKKVSATYNEMKAAAAQLEKEINDLVPGTEAFIKKSKDLQEVKGRMEEVSTSMKGAEKSSWAAKLGLDGITSASGLMKAGFQAAMSALLPLLAVEQLWEMVKAFIGLVNEVDKVKAAINGATGAQGEMLDSLYVRVQAISKTFGDEYTDVLKAADVLAKQMGVSHEEAFDLIEKGYMAGANRSGEFLDNIKEYAPQFKDAGASAEQFIATVTRAELGGVFSDKGADTVKEFGLRIREQTTATRDALDAAFGQDFTNRIFKGINDGSMTVVDAMKEVSAAMNDTTVPASKLQTVVADVFGGPGEDAGLAYLKTLYQVGDGLDSLVDRTNAYVEMQQEQLEANKLLADSEAYLTETFSGTGLELDNLWANIKAGTFYTLGNLVNMIKQTGYSFMAGIEYIKSWGASLGTAFEAIKNRDWAGLKSAFSNAGSDAASAYSKSFAQSMNAAKAEREAAMLLKKQQEQGPQVPGDVHGGGPSRQDDEKAAKAAETARKKKEAEDLAAAKKHAADVRRATEEAARALLAAQRAAEDMQVASIKDKHEREIAEINLQTNRKMETLAGDDEQIMAQWEMMEQARQERIAQVREKQKEEEQKLKDQTLAEQLDQEDIDAQEQAAQLELAFENGLMAEQGYQDALYNLKRIALDNQLALLAAAGKAETAEYKKIATAKINLETDRVKQEKQQKEDLRRFEMAVAQQGAGLLREGLALVEDNLNKKSEAYKIFKAARKMAELAEVGIGLQAELQANSLNAARNPLNAVPGGSALVATQLAIQNGMSIVRAVAAGVKIAAFKQGGDTSSPAEMLTMEQLLPLLSGASGGSFAGGGPVKKGTLGLIGEAGPELVVPNWMYASPKYADLMGFLEAQIASKGNAFAEGGSTVKDFSVGASAGDGTSSQLIGLMQQMVSSQASFQQEISDWARNLTVQNNLQEVKKGLETIQKTQTGGGIRVK